MITLEQIHNKLAEAIKHSGITQIELARRLGVRQSNISHYVKGDKMPALDTLANLCAVLDEDPAYLLCLKDETGAKTYGNYIKFGTHNGNTTINNK